MRFFNPCPVNAAYARWLLVEFAVATDPVEAGDYTTAGSRGLSRQQT